MTFCTLPVISMPRVHSAMWNIYCKNRSCRQAHDLSPVLLAIEPLVYATSLSLSWLVTWCWQYQPQSCRFSPIKSKEWMNRKECHPGISEQTPKTQLVPAGFIVILYCMYCSLKHDFYWSNAPLVSFAALPMTTGMPKRSFPERCWRMCWHLTPLLYLLAS